MESSADLENDARGGPTWRMLMVRCRLGLLVNSPSEMWGGQPGRHRAAGPWLESNDESISSIVSGLPPRAIGTVARRCFSMSNMWTAPASSRSISVVRPVTAGDEADEREVPRGRSAKNHRSNPNGKTPQHPDDLGLADNKRHLWCENRTQFPRALLELDHEPESHLIERARAI